MHTVAVILAGGAGTRMWPFATVRNKVALPIANVPNVRRLVDAVVSCGIREVVVVLGHEAGSVRHALIGAAGAITWAAAPAGAGTAGATLCAMHALEADRYLVLYGDTDVAVGDLRAVLEASAGDASGTALLTSPFEPGTGGDGYAVEVEDGCIVRIIGHDFEARTAACGVMVLPSAIGPLLAANPGRMLSVPVGGMPPADPDLFQSLNDWPGPITAVAASEGPIDLDKPWQVLTASMRAAAALTGALTANEVDPTARVHSGADIRGFVRVGPGSEIGDRVVINGNAIIGANTSVTNGAILHGSNVIGDRCRVSDYCLIGRETVVGNDCIVGHGAEMDGVMLDGSYLYHYCEIYGLVGASVDLGAATVCGTLRFDDGIATQMVKGRRERPPQHANATYYGDFSRTGVNVITMPGARIGCYSCVGAGIVLQGDVPERTLRVLKQETVDKPWGPERYGW